VLGSVRHEIRIRRTAEDVWELAGDARRLHEWFPGIATTAVDGSARVITTGAGIELVEEILVVDHLTRRFQYAITGPPFRHHRGTIDVIDLGDGTTLAVYSTDADPRTMALMIGAGTREALVALKRLMETGAAA
jgi:uncharacterized protein YndB with AHSA1/START domain